MEWKDAVTFCEEHECTECPVYNLNLDKRTPEEKMNQHMPCCENLVKIENIDFILKNQYDLKKVVDIVKDSSNYTYNFNSNTEFPKDITIPLGYGVMIEIPIEIDKEK